MKTLIKGWFVLLLVAVSSSVVLAADEAIPDEPLPPEVKKLIGMKIKTKMENAIPDFLRNSGMMLDKELGMKGSGEYLVYEEGIVKEKWPVFIVSARKKNDVTEILDARLLSGKLLNWRYENGKITRLEDGDFLIFSGHCYYDDNDLSTNNRIVFGLEDPKFEHDGYTTRVERAWEIDQQTGRIKSISAKGIACAVLGE